MELTDKDTPCNTIRFIDSNTYKIDKLNERIKELEEQMKNQTLTEVIRANQIRIEETNKRIDELKKLILEVIDK